MILRLKCKDLKSELPNIMIASDTYTNNIEKRFSPTLISHILLEVWCDLSLLQSDNDENQA